MSESKWEALRLRLVQESKRTLFNNKSDGVAIITVHMMVDGDGTPLFWVVHEGKRIEPSRDAKLAVAELLQRISGSGLSK